MPNPVLIYETGKALGQIGRYLGGRSQAKRRQNQIDAEIARMEAEKKKKFIDVNGAMSAYDRKAVIDSAKGGRRIDRTLGLDTGRGQGGALENLQSQRLGTLGDLRLKNAVGTATRNNSIDNRISSLKLNTPTQPSTAGLLSGLAQTGLEAYGGITQANNAKADALKLQQNQFNVAPKGTYNPSSFDTGYANQKPSPNLTQRTPYSGYGIGGNFTQQPQQIKPTPPPTDYNPQIFKQFKGIQDNYQKSYDKFYKENGGLYYTGANNPDGSPEFKPITKEYYGGINPAPDYQQIFDINNRDRITNELGSNAADSIYNVQAPYFGYNPIPSSRNGGQTASQGNLQDYLPAGGNFSPLTQSGQFANQMGQSFNPQGLSPELEAFGGQEFSDWGELTPDEKMAVLRMIGKIQ